MRNNSIKGLLKIPGYKVQEIFEKTATELHIRVESYKRNKGQCSCCGQEHESVHSVREMVAEDVRLGERRVFLYISKRR